MAITEEERRIRRNHVGSSDMAALFGLDPHGRNAHDLYLEKTGQLPERKATKAMQLGTRLENYVLDWAEFGDEDWDGVGKLGRTFGTAFLSGTQIAVHVDAVTSRDFIPVEAKTHWFGQTSGQWGNDGSDQIPDHVKIQLHTQMLCLDADSGWVVALLGRGLSYFHVPREAEVCAVIRETAQRFWEEHVVPRVPPPDVLPSLDSLSVLHREPRKRAEVDNAVFIDWRAARDARKEHEKIEALAKAALLTAMGDADEAEAIDRELMEWPLLTYYEQSRRGVDTRKLFADHPDLKAEYETVSTYRVLREKKG